MSPVNGGASDSRNRRVDAPATKRTKKLKAFVLRKKGHAYCFYYPARCERTALKAAADCKSLELVDVVALACYLGHDPNELGLWQKT